MAVTGAQRGFATGEMNAGSETVVGAAGATKILSSCAVSVVTAAGATANNFVVPDGIVDGQQKAILLLSKASTGNGVLVSPTKLHGGTTLTFDAALKNALLVWMGGKWAVVGTTATLA